MRRLLLKVPADVVEDYFRLFVNRRAYTLQSDRPHPEGGRHHYYRPTDKTTGQGLSLTSETIRRHLEGEITIGLYAINPATQRCKWVSIDADYKGAMEDLVKLQYYLSQDQVQAALDQQLLLAQSARRGPWNDCASLPALSRAYPSRRCRAGSHPI